MKTMCEWLVSRGGGRCVLQKGWGRFFRLVWWRGGNRRDSSIDFERWRAGHAGALMLWFIAVDGVAGAAVVDNIHARPILGRLFWFVQRRGDD